MDTRLYCAECDLVFPADTWSCVECCGHLKPFEPREIRFAVGTFEPVFQPALTAEPTYSTPGFLRVRQAGG